MKIFSVNREILFCAMLILFTNITVAQTVNPPKIESPNAAGIDKFGQIPVNLFTGTPDINIPVHTLKYGNISVPVALRYHPGLVKPLSHPGWVGLGWDLECSGAITRTIHNYPDEFQITSPFAGQLASYYPGANNPTGRSGSADVSVRNWNASSIVGSYFRVSQNGYVADVEADEFSFNFMGHSGKFYYSASGWQVVSDENIQVILNASPDDFLSASDIDNIINQYAIINQPTGINSTFVSIDQAHQTRAFKSFTLIVPDGTKYIFGGTDAVELYSNYGHGPFSGGPIFNVNTWLLKTIIDVNNNQVNFSYRRSYPTCDLFISASKVDNNCQYTNVYGNSNATLTTESVNVPSGAYSGNFHWPMYLNTITSPNETIQFSGAAATCLRYSNIQLLSLGSGNTTDPQFVNSLLNSNLNNIQWEQLNSITVKNSSNNVYRQYGFNYVPSAGGSALANQRLCLYSFTELDKGSTLVEKFAFTYNNEASLPIYDGDNTDHWGYYNGQSIASHPVSQVSSLRATNSTKVTTGLLNAISYPSGGYTKLSWEAHDYSQVVPPARSPLTNQTGYAGGSRIADISNYLANNSLVSEKKYIYKRGYTTGSSGLTSSGILNGNPMYVFNILDRYGVNNIAKYSVHLESINPLSTYSYNSADSYIGYDEVAEVNLDGSYSRHFFTSYGTDLNGIPHYDQAIVGVIGWVISNDNYYPFATLEMERGKPVANYDYTSSNVPLHKIQYNYRNDAGRFSSFIKRIDNDHAIYSNSACTPDDALIFASPNTVFSYSYYPISKTETTYDQTGANPVVQTETYAYNSNNLITTKIATNSKNETVTTNYKYPTDYTNTSDPSQSTYQAMFAPGTHIISPVVETSITNTANSVVNSVSLTHINYYTPYVGKYMPQNVQMQVASNSIETRQQIFSNDGYGNIQEEGKPNGMHTVYLWGYNGEYPVAKIVGSTYSVVNQIVTQSSIDNAIANDLANSTNGSYLRAALAPLYSSSNLSNALISTYTYAPLIGMMSETDPKGFSIFYNYDAFGRLMYIQDVDNNMLKRFNYSLSGPNFCNAVQSATFTKQGCTSGTPPSLIYTVPACTFTSSTDPNTANQLAINYMNTNGQAAANALTCPPISCSFSMSTGCSSLSSGLTSNGTTASGYLVWYTSTPLNAGNSYPIATITGSCKPSVNRYLTISSNGINWNVTIFSNGQVGVQMPYGSPQLPANTTVYFNPISYNL